ncbi:MAG: glycosyltransferase family 39 protein [Acidobacteria bacterium]|nr:MAG: glycosyltransferase family 39 protein [Acidobacteriota bacterium]
MTALRALLVASAILLFVDLGGSTIWDANEAFYVETPRQMVLTHDYVNPSFNGQPRFNKPVLSYWIVAGFYKVLGVSVTAERVAIAFGAVLLIGATFVIGRTLGGPNAGVIAALVLASAPRVMLWSRRIFIDVWFASFLALALMCFVLADAYPARRRLALIGMYIAIGLAVLTKGPVALALPGLALLVHLTMTRTLRDLRTMVPIGAVIIAAIVAPWYVADYQQHGWAHIREFFIGENLGRYTETVGFQNRGPFFYVPVLLSDLTPWSLFLPAALWLAWRERRPDLRLMVIWIAVFAGVFTLSKTKQDLYIFPAAPAIAALIGVLIDRTARAGAGRWRDAEGRLARGGALVTSLLLVALGALAIQLTWLTDAVPNLRAAAVVGGVLIAGGVLSAALAFRARLVTVALALGATAVVVNWLLVLFVMRPFEAFKPVAPMSEWLREHAGATTVVAHYRTQLPSMTYYLGRPVTQVFDPDAMTRLIDREPGLYVMARPGEIAEIMARNGVPVCVVQKRPLPVFDAKLSEIRSGRLPEIWLAGIKNVCK